VLGRPIGHSLSPILHRAAYAELGLPWIYDALDCDVSDLPGVLAERAHWAGFSCTMPLKHAALEAATEVRPLARAVGAANTLLPRPGGGWIADNTDVAGVVGALRESAVAPSSVVILGAGGTAQAVVAALAELGAGECCVLLRDPSRSGPIERTARTLGVRVTVGQLSRGVRLDAGLIVSTLPAGGADRYTEQLSAEHAVFDVVYDPWPTPLASAAIAAGATVVSGALMLLHQAAAQVALMTGQPAPIAQMRAALQVELPGAGL
jgi:shikimate dehydrogenase